MRLRLYNAATMEREVRHYNKSGQAIDANGNPGPDPDPHFDVNCIAFLPPSGQVGRRLRATGERWYYGHKVGVFPSPQPRIWNDPTDGETR
jgi:hypothetical protein